MFHKGIFRDIELELRQALYYNQLGFDYAVNPFITIPALFNESEPDSFWGLSIGRHDSGTEGGSWSYAPPLLEYDDIGRLRKPEYSPDFSRSEELRQQVEAVLRGIIEVRQDFGGRLGISASLGYHAAALRGLQPLMTDVVDNPEWVHRLMRFLLESHLEWLDAYERYGKVSENHIRWPFFIGALCHDYDQSKVRLRDCWGHGESQEFDLFSPDMFDEFLLAYQIPIFEKTSLNNYGCCESLTLKYRLLEKIPALRRVAVSPWTDFKAALEWSAGKHVLNWRYSPEEVIFRFSEEAVRKNIRRNLELAGGNHVEIVLQDIETFNRNPQVIGKWISIAMEESEKAKTA